MKKLLALLLVIAMMLTMLVACNDNDDPQETQGPNKPAAKPKDEEDEDAFDITEILPADLNYNNQEVVLCVRSDNKWEIGLDGEDPEPLSAELYDRTTRTEERLTLAVTIDELGTWDTYNNSIATMRNNIQYQEHKWDIIVGLSWRFPQLASEGLLYNLSNFAYFDSTNIWWSQSLARELTVNGRMFMASGDVSIDYMESAHTVFFNQALAKAMDMDYSTFYKTVSEGKWTFDELYNLSKDAYSDLNGSTTRDSGDQFGLLIQSTMLQAFYTAAGCNMIPNDGETRPEFVVNTEQLEQVWAKISNLINVSSTVEYAMEGTLLDNNFRNYFMESKALFAIMTLGSLKRFTGMTDSFGVLPMPKYDEAQESYYSQLHGCELWSVPLDANDPDMSTAVMTSMGYDSHEVVLEPHFEKLLKTRYVKDSESGYMIDTIYYNIYMNFDSIYNEVLMPGPDFSDKNQMPMFMFGALLNGTYGSAAAWWSSNQNGLKAELEMILEGFYN